MRPVTAAVLAAIIVATVAVLIFQSGPELAPPAPADDRGPPGGRATAPGGGNGLDRPSTDSPLPVATGQRAGGETGDRDDPDNPEETETPVLPPGPEALPEGGALLAVHLARADGESPRGLVVSLLAGRSAGEVETDVNGTAVFARIGAGTYTVRVSGPDLPPLESATTVPLEEGEEREVTFAIGFFDLALGGRVLDQFGQPVPGIVVDARRSTTSFAEGDLLRSDQARRHAVTGANGTYRIAGLEAVEYVLATTATDVYPAVRQTFRAGVTSADLRLTAAAEVEVTGVVTTPEGAPIADARVTALGYVGAGGRTNAEGAFSVSLRAGDPRAVCTLKVTRGGFRSADVQVPLGGPEGVGGRHVEITLERLGEVAVVSGWIYDQNGEPLPGEVVYLYSPKLRSRHQGASGPEGGFQIADVELADDYRAWVYSKRGFGDWKRSALTVGPGGLEIEIELEELETGSVRGQMVDPEGRPVAGFQFWLRSLRAQGSTTDVTGDADGRFEVLDAPVGDLVFETRSLPRFTIKGWTLEPDAVLDVKLVLDWGDAELTGTVVAPGGTPVPTARVQLMWTHKEGKVQSTSFRSGLSDADGRFTFTRVASGVHRIHVSASGFRTTQVSHDVGRAEREPVVELKSPRRPR